jgi:hypothetical protein
MTGSPRRLVVRLPLALTDDLDRKNPLAGAKLDYRIHVDSMLWQESSFALQ